MAWYRTHHDAGPAGRAGRSQSSFLHILPWTRAAERRRDRRQPVHGVEIRIGDWKLEVENLSLGGFLAKSYHGSIKDGEQFAFTLHLPLAMRTMEVTGKARVIRVEGGRLAAEYISVNQRLMRDLFFYLNARG